MIISSILILVYFAIYIWKYYVRRVEVNAMCSKMISMVLGMSNSLLIGTHIGILLQGELALSTILSISISFVMAIIIGKPFSQNAIIEAICSSVMGAMMGAMLGEMLKVEEMTIMLLFLHCLYIISMSYMIFFAGRTISPIMTRKNAFSFLISVVTPIIIVASISQISIPTTTEQPVKTTETEHVHQHE